MINIHYKEGTNKNGKPYMLCYLDFTGKDGQNHRERFFIRPWNVTALKEAIESEAELSNQVKEIYG